MDDALIDAYLARIGAPRPALADLAALIEMTEAHVLTVPFENLDYHCSGRPIELGERAILKIVNERRGGGCYEVNPAFGLLLEALGFRVRILPGRVARPDGWSAPLCHMVLRVDLDEPWLVDVGFGRNSRQPLRLDERGAQVDPHGEYCLADTDEGDVELSLAGRPLYCVEQRPRELAEFVPTLWWYQTAPDSPFLQNSFCVLRTRQGRVSLTGRTLTVSDADGKRTEELDDAAYLERLRAYFGVELKAMPILPEDADPVAS